MVTLYWLALVLGGGLGLFSLFGGWLDSEIELETPDPDAWHLFSLRSATYFLFSFGGVGLLTRLNGSSDVASLVLATVTGIVAAVGSAALFRYLRRSTASPVPADASLVGLTGAVVLPLRRNAIGKIVVQRGDREIELLARPFEEDATDLEQWDQVVVVDMSAGTALVSPYPNLPQIPSSTE